MKRYQVYLNQHSVSLLDEFGENIDISRSQLIRLSIEQVTHNLGKIFVAKEKHLNKKNSLDNLIGIIKVKGSKQTNYAMKHDEIYLKD